jgi:hypothetical protein
MWLGKDPNDGRLNVYTVMKPRISAVGTTFFLPAKDISHGFRRPQGGSGHQPDIVGLIHVPFKGAAGGFRTGKIPEIGKIAALLRFYGLNRAPAGLQKNALAIWLVHQGETATIRSQARELLDEIVLGHGLKICQPGNFRFRKPHLPRPATASRAALTFKEDRHRPNPTIHLRITPLSRTSFRSCCSCPSGAETDFPFLPSLIRRRPGLQVVHVLNLFDRLSQEPADHQPLPENLNEGGEDLS